MDQYTSAIIIAVISGLFSILTIVIQRKQTDITEKFNEQTALIAKEQTLRKKLIKQEKDLNKIIQKIILIILDTNLHILRNSQIAGATLMDKDIYDKSDKLKEEFNTINENITNTYKEYELVLSIDNSLESQI